jgi:hypothetical protein
MITLIKNRWSILVKYVKRYKEQKMKRSIYMSMLFCITMIFAISAPAYAAQGVTTKRGVKPFVSKRHGLSNSQVITIEGIIQNVSNGSIEVRNKSYSISGVPLLNPSGKYLKNSSLQTGKRVEIFFLEGRITSILVYDDMLQ